MTNETNGTTPELVVLGRDETGKPRAARFPADQANLVVKAAEAMNLTVCKADGEVLAELAKKLQTGRLYATGRAFVPPVGRSLYDRLIEQLKFGGQAVPDEIDATVNHAVPGLPTTWDDIAVGHLVLAPEEGAKAGWWEAIVLARDGDMLTLKWRDWLGYPNITRHAGSVALLKPIPVAV